MTTLPAGWMLVPVDPTIDMLSAADNAGSIPGPRALRIYVAMLAAAPTPPASAQPERDWELTCDGCDGDGFVYVERRVGPCATDIQTFKEDCECCDGRGFVFAFEDIPGIEEYVKSCRSGTQDAPITVSLDPDPRGVSIGVWQGSHCIYNGAHAVPSALDKANDEMSAVHAAFDRGYGTALDHVARPAPAAGDAQTAAAPEWAACESRRPWVTNSLKANAQELRDKEKRCRTAFNKDFMGLPARYVADAYAEAAAIFETKLAAITAQQGKGGEA